MQKLFRYCLLLSLLLGAVSGRGLTARIVPNVTSACAGAATGFVFNGTTSGATGYSWYHLGTLVGSTAIYSTTLSAADSYTYVLVVDSSGVRDTDSVTVHVYPAPVTRFSIADTAMCPHVSTVFSDSSFAGSPGRLRQYWDFGDGLHDTGRSPHHTFNYPGVYHITLIDTNGQGCFNAAHSGGIVHVYDTASVGFSAPVTSFCHPPDTVTFSNTTTGFGTLHYLWRFGNGDTSITSASSFTHIYTHSGTNTVSLVVTDGHGCKDSSVAVNYIFVAHTAISVDSTGCAFAPVTFTDSSDAHIYTYWSFGDGGSSLVGPVATHTYSSRGVYPISELVVFATSPTYLYCTLTDTIRIYPDADTFFTSPVHPCPEPDTIHFNGVIHSGDTVRWQFGDGGTAIGDSVAHVFMAGALDSAVTVDTCIGASYSTYRLNRTTMYVTDRHGCRDTVRRADTVYNMLFDIFATKTKGCAPLTDSFRTTRLTTVPYLAIPVAYPFATTSYSWNFRDGSSLDTSARPHHVFTATGVYSVTCTITTSNGCTFQDTIVIGVGSNTATASFSASPAALCYHALDTFHASTTGSPVTVDQLAWDFHDGVLDTSTYSTTKTHQFQSPGSYLVTVIPFNHGCPGTPYTSTTAIVVHPPKAAFTYAYDCRHSDSIFVTSTSIGATSLLWSFPDASHSTARNPRYHFSSTTSGQIWLFTSDSASHCTDTAVIAASMITARPHFSVTDTTICLGDTVTLRSDSNASDQVIDYHWRIGHWDTVICGACGSGCTGIFYRDSTKITHRFDTVGVDTTMLILTDAHGCYDTFTRHIFVSKPVARFISSATTCFYDTVRFTDTSTAATYAPITHHHWYYGDHDSGYTRSHTAAHHYAPGSGSDYIDSYRVKEIVIDTAGCMDSVTAMVHLYHPRSTVSGYRNQTEYCVGDLAQIWISYLDDSFHYYTFRFSDGGIITDSNTVTHPFGHATHLYAHAGTDTIFSTVIDDHGCVDSSISIFHIWKPHASFSVSDSLLICPTNYRVNFDTTGSRGAISFNWNFGDHSGGVVTTPRPSHIYDSSSAGTDTVRLIVTDVHGCSDTASKNVSFFNGIGGFNYPDSGCGPLPVDFTMLLTGFDSLKWEFNDGSPQVISYTNDTQTHAYHPGLYVPELYLNKGGCWRLTTGLDTIKVDSVTMDARVTTDTVCLFSPIAFIDSSRSMFYHINYHKWQFTPTDSSRLDSASYTFRTSGAHTVTLFSSDGVCRDSLHIPVYIYPRAIVAHANSTICIGDSVKLWAIGDTSGYTWLPDSTLRCTSCDSPFVHPTITTTYTVTGISAYGCHDTATVKITVLPRIQAGPIQGPTHLCLGQSANYSDTAHGSYAWWLTNVRATHSGSRVTAARYGMDTVVLRVYNACFSDTVRLAIWIDTLRDAGTITGDSICVSVADTLHSSDTTGHWFASNGNATIDSITGIINAVSAGIDTICYVVNTPACGNDTNRVAINILPLPFVGPIHGLDSLCQGDTVSMTDSIAGGVWMSSNPAIATITATGAVIGRSSGIDTIRYVMVSSSCGADTAIKIIRVNPLPNVSISPIMGVCQYSSTTLTATPIGGLWNTYSSATASISFAGVLSGLLVDTTTVTYTITQRGCTTIAYRLINVWALPTVTITGPTHVCAGYSMAVTNLCTPPGGTGAWTTATAASIFTLSGSLIVHGVSRGTGIITYTYTDPNGCVNQDTALITVDSIPRVPAITIKPVLCANDSFQASDSLAGGRWSISNPAVATVDSITGMIHGVHAGSCIITYSFVTASGCSAFITDTCTVRPLPPVSFITGPDTICAGYTGIYVDTAGASAGVWSTSDTLIARVDRSLTGGISGVSVGNVTVSYTVTANGSGCINSAIKPIYVRPAIIVPPIEGIDTLCIDDVSTLTDSIEGGSWVSYNPDVADIDPVTGDITAFTAGVAVIAYEGSTVCGPYQLLDTVLVVGPYTPITGNMAVCSGDTTPLYNVLPGGTWTSDDTSIATVDSFSGLVTGVASGSVTIRYTVSGPCGTNTDTATVVVNMIPYITTNSMVACQSLTSSGDGGIIGPPVIVSDSNGCLLVCDSTIVHYKAHGVFGSAFTWVVTGGTIVGSSTDSVVAVLWSTAGIRGTVTLYDSVSHCTGSATACIKVIKRPHANFTASARTVCAGDAVQFWDHSTADSLGRIRGWVWDFGDGYAISNTTSANPNHVFNTAGVYTVTLVVKNACNCTDTFRMTIKVDENPGPVIQCPSFVCQNDKVHYTISAGCAPHWSVIGGTIIAGAGTSDITVFWNHVDSTGFGYVSVADPCALCPDTTTVKVPVLLLNAAIQGPAVICANQQYRYYLPLWPATDYEWGVLGYPGLIVGYNDDYQMVVNFPAPGTYTLHAWYQNRLKLCGGNVTRTITVVAPVAINGATAVCAGNSVTYSLSGSHVGYWTVTDPTGIRSTTASPSATFTISFSTPGAYLVSASGNFCANPVTVNVIPLPPPIDSLLGADTVCLGRVYTYQAKNTVAGATYYWQAIGGSVSPASGSDIVDVVWNSTGPKRLIVSRISLFDTLHCSGPAFTKSIIQEVIHPVITGDVYPCSNGKRAYSSNYNRGEAYEWSIFPDSLGSIVGGIHTTNTVVLWNNVTTPTTVLLRIKTQKCDSVKTDSLVINLQPSPTVSITPGSTLACPGYPVTFTATVGGTSYYWNFGDGVTAYSLGNSITHRFPRNTTPSNVVYHVRVSVSPDTTNPCPVTGDAIYTMTVLPGPVAFASTAGPTDICGGRPRLINGTATTNVGTLSYQWFNTHGAIGGAVSGTYLNHLAGSFNFVVTAGNGCTDTSNLVTFRIFCDSSNAGVDTIGSSGGVTTPCGRITATATTDGFCAPFILKGTPGTAMEWRAERVPDTLFSWPGWTGNRVLGRDSVHALYDSPGVYRFTYFVTLPGGCRDSVSLMDTIPLVPDFRYTFRCAPGGYDSVFLTDYSVYLPWVRVDSFQWYFLPTSVHDTGSSVTKVMPIGHFPGVTEYVYFTYPDGTYNACGRPRGFEVPARTHPAFTYATDYLCETIPMSFTPTVTTGITQYKWDFGDRATSLLQNTQRTYNWQGPGNPRAFPVVLTVRDTIGCTDTATHDSHVWDNLLGGKMDANTAICPDAVPFTVNYLYAAGAASPISYLWSTGDTTTVPYKNIYNTGAYFVTLFDVHQCQHTIAKAENVKVLHTPKAHIYGKQDYCVGDPVILSGYAGPGVTYSWEVDGVPDGTSANIYDPVMYIGDHNYKLAITAMDTPTGTTCTDITTMTVHVHDLPEPPTITGPLVVDCDRYQLQLVASETAPGVFNWSNGASGDTIDIYSGGPYRAWFTDNTGCRSYSDINVPLSPDYYLQYFPVGCYTLCTQQLPLTLYGPPHVSFTHWDWIKNTTPVRSGSGQMSPYTFGTGGTYKWKLNNGLCAKVSDDMNLSTVNCNNCGLVELSVTMNCTPSNPVCYAANININAPVGTTYTLGTSKGPVYPFSGNLTLPSTHLMLTFATLDTLATSVVFEVEFTLPGGMKCFKKVLVILPPCRWIAEKPDTSGGATDLQMTTAMLVYPNPASREVNIAYDYGTEQHMERSISVYDQMGRKVDYMTSLDDRGNWKLNTSDWLPGIYIIRMEADGKAIQLQKLVVSN